VIRSKSKYQFEKAQTLFPGGVNSPVRAFKSVGGTPLFFEKGDGPFVWDIDGNKFIDFCCSWGPLILGHNDPEVSMNTIKALKNGSSFGAPTIQENKLADFILNRISFIDKIRFVSSGTEAVMSAIRLARGYTNKSKIIKFEGCYHGHVDSLMVKAGSGLATLGTSSSAGVPENLAKETLVLPLGNVEQLEKALSEYENEIACVIIEPIPANNGLLLQNKSFLQRLRELCSSNDVLLIFDEVISGFRVAFGGAAELYGITPDIVTYGKIIGGGLPVGAYGAKNHIMSFVSPEGPVYQAGTLSGNPVAMAAGLTQLKTCATPRFYDNLEKKTVRFIEKINDFCKEKKLPLRLFSIGSIFWFSFSEKHRVYSANQINSDMSRFNILHEYCLENGVYLGPSGYEVGFISSMHLSPILEDASEVIIQGIKKCFDLS
jgi:glutamate-1-semialdehyde 2,1-aminomutase